MSGTQLVILWALFAIALIGIPAYALGWWNGRRCLRGALVAAPVPDLEVRVISVEPTPPRIASRLPISITCPQCGRTSYNPEDIAQGYCGGCHDWTSARLRVSEDPFPTTPFGLWSPRQAGLDATQRQTDATTREIEQMIADAAERDPYRRRPR